MKRSAAELVARALADEGVRWAFGIPGTHNTELYDALERSPVLPVLVTDEQCASFMADAVSRSGPSLGVVNVVPGAGVTHCLSGVAEAYLDNIPLLVLTCGVRRDTGKAYQLHDVDQLALLSPVTKGVFRPERAADVYPVLREACALARRGAPGPVAVEIPANLYLVSEDVPEPGPPAAEPPPPSPTRAELDEAARLLNAARSPALYLGFGVKGAGGALVELAERLGAPVATTIQGKGVFPESHPLWAWNGFGAMAPPFARDAFKRSDCLLAIGCRFGEVATASYGAEPPSQLLHVDIDPSVLGRNYPTRLGIVSDAASFVRALLPLLVPRDAAPLLGELSEGHASLRRRRLAEPSQGRVTPVTFFEALQKEAGPSAIYATDSGNGTFLAMEHLRLDAPGRFLGPIDYSCMGYAVPAAIGARFAHPDAPVVALAGDGAFLMTGMELLTAAHYGAAPVVFLLRDGELGQIAQFQRASLDRDTCSILSPYEAPAMAQALRCEFFALSSDERIGEVLRGAFAAARAGHPALVELALDYSRKTFFTQGVLKTNFWRLPLHDRFRMAFRLLARKVGSALTR